METVCFLINFLFFTKIFNFKFKSALTDFSTALFLKRKEMIEPLGSKLKQFDQKYKSLSQFEKFVLSLLIKDASEMVPIQSELH